MSVIFFDAKEIGQIAFTVLNGRSTYTDFSRCVCDRMEEADLKSFTKTAQEFEDGKETMILCWAQRLFYANQLAYILTYRDAEKKLVDLEDSDIHGPVMGLREFHNKLQSIHYNLFSNNGRCMFGKEDMERLETLIRITGEEIIRAGERGAAL